MSERELALSKMEPIHGQLPIVFANGRRWDKFVTYCAHCNEEIFASELKGEIVKVAPDVYTVEAMGHCPWCWMWSRYSVRLRDDMTMDGYDPRTGNWLSWEAKPTLGARINRFFRWLVGRA
jgi:hypothetical protein